MAEKRVIAVVGATGAQGGGLVRAILADPSGGFAARALTRDPSSPKAQALARQGVEVVGIDLEKPETVRGAFAGAYGAFCVTFFWEHFSPEKEIAHATTMAEAAKGTDVKHVIWSTLEDTRKWVPLGDDRMPTLMGSYKVPHFDAKGEANQVFSRLGVPTTFLLTSFYWDNLISFGMGPKKGDDGKLSFALPMGDKKLPGIAAEDIGKCAYGIFKQGTSMVGKTVGIAGEHLTGADMARALGQALGTRVRYRPIPVEMYRKLGFPGAEDLGNMFQFKAEFEQEFCGARPVEVARRLNPELQSFGAWLEHNAERIKTQ